MNVERPSTVVGEGGLQSVRDLIEVMTELEHSSEVVVPSQMRQRNHQVSIEDIDTGKKRLSPKARNRLERLRSHSLFWPVMRKSM